MKDRIRLLVISEAAPKVCPKIVRTRASASAKVVCWSFFDLIRTSFLWGKYRKRGLVCQGNTPQNMWCAVDVYRRTGIVFSND